MYSKPFKKQRHLSAKEETEKSWNAPKPTVLKQLATLNSEFENKRGKLLKADENRESPQNLAGVENLQLAAYRNFEAIEHLWRQFESGAECFMYQQFEFCRTWYDTVGKKDDLNLHIVIVTDLLGETVMLVPLCFKKGPFGTVVSFVGDGMADYLCPLVRKDFASSLNQNSFDELWQKIMGTFEVTIDLLWLDRQPINIVDVVNPMVKLNHFTFASSAHALNFPEADDWAKCARILRSNKTVGNLERRLRKLAKLGHVELVEVTDPVGREEHMQKLLAMKVENLNDAGLLHRMNTSDVKQFHQALVGNTAQHKNMHQFELRCDDKIVASVLGFVHRNTFYYQVCAFNKEDFGQHSPGLLLLYKLFDWSFARGLKRFDMTIGDEAYKNDWRNDTTPMVTVAVAYTFRGKVNYTRKRLILSLKEFIKNSALLSKLAMRVLK